MYTMKDACDKTGLSYETLKFYCNQGLVPNVKRDKNNRRIFNVICNFTHSQLLKIFSN